MARSAPRRRTCRGFPDRPCYAPLTGGNAQKRCPPCAAEANRRRRPGDNSTYYQKHRLKILANRHSAYWAKVNAKRQVLQRYTFYKELMEALHPGQKVLSFDEWRNAGLGDKPSILERIFSKKATGTSLQGG